MRALAHPVSWLHTHARVACVPVCVCDRDMGPRFSLVRPLITVVLLLPLFSHQRYSVMSMHDELQTLWKVETLAGFAVFAGSC